MRSTTLPSLLLTLAFVAFMAGCALVESAAEVTIGRGQLPAMEVSLALPAPSELLGETMPGAPDSLPVTGIPTSFDAVTLGHVQGLLSLAGTCVHSHSLTPEADPDPATDGEGDDGGVTDLQVEVVSCPTGGWCAAWCGTQTGLMLRFGLEMAFVDGKQASNIREQLSADIGDAIAQVRLRFLKLSLSAGGELDAAATAAMIQRFDVDLVDEDGNRARVIEKRDLEQLADGEPLRSEIPPESALTDGLRRRLQQGQAIRVRVEATLVVSQADLLAWPVNGTELVLALQPEIVISTVSLAAGLL